MGLYALRKPWNCWWRADFKIKTSERFARKCNKTVINVWQLKYGLLETGMADEPTINYVDEICRSWDIEKRSQEYEDAK